jgi:GGDEF domain-containing protein
MRVFDQIDPTTLDRRELHLWSVAIAVILILAAGLALLMYPTVFSDPVILSGPTMRKTFFGFCALSVLFAGYLLDRQLTIRRLRNQINEEQRRMAQARHEASADLLASLPGFSFFQDRLAMEFRRASNTQQPFSLIVVQLKQSRDLTDSRDIETALGDAAKALLRTLRREDSLYSLRASLFGILLPDLSTKDANHILDRAEERLQAAAGASERFSFEMRVVNYPEHAASARDMEKMATSLLGVKQPEAHHAN